MKLTTEEMVGMVLMHAEHVDISNLGLNLHLTNIFWALDGSRTVKAIARQDRYDLNDLADKINTLIEKGLVTNPIDDDTVSQTFMDSAAFRIENRFKITHHDFKVHCGELKFKHYS